MIPSGLENLFELRWIDGYRPVTTASPAVAAAISRAASEVDSSSRRVTMAVPRVSIEGRTRSIGVLRFDTLVSSGPRTLRYLHAVAFPRGYQLSLEQWQRLVERRYGERIEDRIREVYEVGATSSPDDGQRLLRDLEIEDGDIDEILGGPTHELQADEPPRRERVPTPPSAARWLALATAALALALIAVVWRPWSANPRLYPVLAVGMLEGMSRAEIAKHATSDSHLRQLEASVKEYSDKLSTSLASLGTEQLARQTAERDRDKALTDLNGLRVYNTELVQRADQQAQRASEVAKALDAAKANVARLQQELASSQASARTELARATSEVSRLTGELARANSALAAKEGALRKAQDSLKAICVRSPKPRGCP